MENPHIVFLNQPRPENEYFSKIKHRTDILTNLRQVL